MFRRRGGGVEVLLVHPGGPYWAKKDAAAWSIPKGGIGVGEDPLAAAKREFVEETGFEPPGAGYVALGEVRQAGGKIVKAWAVEGDLDAAEIRSNEFEMEWPPRSGKMQKFPEVDRAGWFGLEEARGKMVGGQVGLVEALGRVAGV